MASENWLDVIEKLTGLTDEINTNVKDESSFAASRSEDEELLLEDGDEESPLDSSNDPSRRAELPSVCKDYNADGCQRVDCRRLHVCYYWVNDKCLNDDHCSKKHTIDDVLNQCVLSALGWSHDHRHKAFQEMKFAYKSGRHPALIASKVCLDYSTSYCRSVRCKRFHVCHGFLLETCLDANLCHLRHDPMSGTHNAELAKELEFQSSRDLNRVLKKSLADVEISPSICDEYNIRRGCHKNYCNQLHCCKFFALYGNCRFKGECYKTHTLASFHNRKVLDRFGLSGHQALTRIRNRCSKNNLNRWESRNDPISSSVERLKRRNDQLEREIQMLRIGSVIRW